MMHVLETWWEAWVHGYFINDIDGILWVFHRRKWRNKGFVNRDDKISLNKPPRKKCLKTDPFNKKFVKMIYLLHFAEDRL